ncbi:UDP-glucose--hexose-1-phosphate uridylyltransferase [Bombilactobacillus thymidiniphilus]|uniref:Galactose-1-phosphate uridylyltransferase n=1 Tax=Bombilactobacillus thymidiniphilus TaxID=2923363 RepID=A0ABY4PBQ0_9LACO|nr:UDP-glucose--hexose-1-phosphate uridylyltransferase [Bombilactobacillus thymidiniphilus]UQS83093.1 UDP-glucose--hexose-1-phosphate uridylyltransferase [Bombilactobacillus thymidiniphilus]
MQDLAELLADQIIATQQTFAPLDRRYLINRIYQLVKTDCDFDAQGLDTPLKTAQALAQLPHKNITETEILQAQLTDLYTPTPADLNQQFWNKYQIAPQEATDYFYQISTANDYVKTAAIAKNIHFAFAGQSGTLEITINLSKPEKDPKAIARQQTARSTDYPLDALSFTNEGFAGDDKHAARANHRLVRLLLSGETWGLQYSPYAYFAEHCIVVAAAQRSMKIETTTLTNLLELVRLFPHYFFGSNADLPIVGGSILAHDHYQGGRHEFPMFKAPIRQKFVLPQFTHVEAGIVDWPATTIRLQGTSASELVVAGTQIMQTWQHYCDESVDVRAFTNDIPHHTVTPIARKKVDHYILELVLRDNQTSAQFPDGIFHPHPQWQHIKRENIGLIEIMGLAILPPRLLPELKQVKQYLLGQSATVKDYHQAWAQQLLREHQITPENVDLILQKALGQIFEQILTDTGVFKNNAQGKQALQRFLTAVNQTSGEALC